MVPATVADGPRQTVHPPVVAGPVAVAVAVVEVGAATRAGHHPAMVLPTPAEAQPVLEDGTALPAETTAAVA